MTQQLAQWACLVFVMLWLGLFCIGLVREVSNRKADSATAMAFVLMISGILALLLRAAGTFSMIF